MVGNTLGRVKRWEDLPEEIKGTRKYTVKPSFKLNAVTLPYIDPKIRKSVVLLNEVGYRTTGSCQGHFAGGNAWDQTFVSFRYKNRDELKKLMRITRKMRGKSIHFVTPRNRKEALVKFTAKDNRTRSKQLREFNAIICKLKHEGSR